MNVSVVIPAYNAQETVGKAVSACLAQATGSLEVEVIVVDDGSSDNTAEIAKSAGARVIRQVNAGPASARNRGWQSAKGRFICFTDADCIPSANWVVYLLEGFTDSHVGAVAGSYEIANSHSWLARWVHREIMVRHARMPYSVRAFGSYNVAIPRYVLEAIGGFDSAYSSASGEDNDLSYRIIKKGWRIAFRPQAKVAHYHPEKVWKYLREQYRHGFWRAKLYKQHPDMVGGDDYTLWRDRVEPALILGIAGCATLNLLGITSLFWPLFTTLVVYTCIHFSWPVSWWLGRGEIDALPYAGVTFMRGFARTLGLCAGILRFGLQLAWFKQGE